MDERPSPVDVATRLAQSRFAGACVWCCGSVMRGEATASSDIDLIVLYPSLASARRESFVCEGWPVEAFIHDEETFAAFAAKDAKGGWPSLATMVTTGKPVAGEPAVVERVVRFARAIVEGGPEALSVSDVEDRRYAITDLVDDLTAPRSTAEVFGITLKLVPKLSDVLLRHKRQWSGDGKWMARALLAFDQSNGSDWLPRLQSATQQALTGDAAPLVELAEAVLLELGGRRFDGHVRVAPSR